MTNKKRFEKKVVSLQGTDFPRTENWCNFSEISLFSARFFNFNTLKENNWLTKSM